MELMKAERVRYTHVHGHWRQVSRPVGKRLMGNEVEAKIDGSSDINPEDLRKACEEELTYLSNLDSYEEVPIQDCWKATHKNPASTKGWESCMTAAWTWLRGADWWRETCRKGRSVAHPGSRRPHLCGR